MAEAPVLVDTSYFVALLNPRDANHGKSVALARRWSKRNPALLTHDAVLIELANFFARSPLRGVVHSAIVALRANPGWLIDRVEPALLARAERRYGRYLDKEWSLTDCISMELMSDHGCNDAATTDKHFEQAGFRALMA